MTKPHVEPVEPAQLVERALAVIQADRFPYLATALFASPVVEAHGIGTVSVDQQWRLYVDPEAANHWSVPQLGSTLVRGS